MTGECEDLSQSQNHLGRNLLVLAGIFLLMLVLNHLMPLHRDDYDYSLIWMTTEHITSAQDTVYSAYRHYLLHGGRMFTVLCLNFFLWLGKFAFDIANALMFPSRSTMPKIGVLVFVDLP